MFVVQIYIYIGLQIYITNLSTAIIMKTLIIFLLFAYCSSAKGQNLKEYLAPNNILYKIGDTLKLGKGSGTNGSFVYLEMNAVMTALISNGGNTTEGTNGVKQYANTNQIIKKIRKYSSNGASKVYFDIKGGTRISINEAIEECEVLPCKSKL